jgi:hypothetical protein
MRLEWLILADWAQIVGGKLYLQGGGWDVLVIRAPFPVTQPIAIAASFSVPWEATNQRHDVEIEIQTEDGVELTKLGGQFELGRPPGIKPGQAQRFQIAANTGLSLQSPGTYVVIARLQGQEVGRTSFNVVSAAMAAAA